MFLKKIFKIFFFLCNISYWSAKLKLYLVYSIAIQIYQWWLFFDKISKNYFILRLQDSLNYRGILMLLFYYFFKFKLLKSFCDGQKTSFWKYWSIHTSTFYILIFWNCTSQMSQVSIQKFETAFYLFSSYQFKQRMLVRNWVENVLSCFAHSIQLGQVKNIFWWRKATRFRGNGLL